MKQIKNRFQQFLQDLQVLNQILIHLEDKKKRQKTVKIACQEANFTFINYVVRGLELVTSLKNNKIYE